MAPIVRRTQISTPKAPQFNSLLSQAVTDGHTVYVSGQLGFDLETKKLVSGGAAKEAEQALKHLGNILEAAGSSFDKILKTTIFLANISDYPAVNEVYAKFVKSKPARSAFAVANLPKGASFEIEVVALTGDVKNVGPVEKINVTSKL